MKHSKIRRMKPNTVTFHAAKPAPLGAGSIAGILLTSLALAGPVNAQTAVTDDAQQETTTTGAAELDTIPLDDTPPPVETAEDEAPQEMTEIVVTATKRNQTVREIPTTINVLSGEQLERQGARQLSEFIDQVPGVKMEDQAGAEPRKIAVRGVGPDTNTNQTVGTVLGDVPLGDPYGSYTIVDPDPFDLKTVEVLKGPQGSLFGASSLSGLIRYVPNAPTLGTWQGKGFVEWTSIDNGGSEPTYGAMINVPVGSSFALRGAGVLEHAPGYVDYDTPGYVQKNADDSHKRMGRVMALWQPTDRLSINLLAMDQRAKADQFSSVTNGDYQLERDDSPTANPYRRAFKLASLDARYEFDWATLVSLSGYQEKLNRFDQDITYNTYGEALAKQGITLIRGLRDVRAHGFVQELRLVSPDDGPWTWLVGAVYSSYAANIESNVYIPYAATGTQALTSLLGALGLGDLSQGLGDEYGLTVGKQVLDPLNAKERALFGELTRTLGPVKPRRATRPSRPWGGPSTGRSWTPAPSRAATSCGRRASAPTTTWAAPGT